jgi:hypothetical protein
VIETWLDFSMCGPTCRPWAQLGGRAQPRSEWRASALCLLRHSPGWLLALVALRGSALAWLGLQVW